MLIKRESRSSRFRPGDKVRLIRSSNLRVGVVCSVLTNPDRVYIEWPTMKSLLFYGPAELEIASAADSPLGYLLKAS